MKHSFTIPTELKDVTIRQYQAFQAIPEELTSRERYEAILKALTSLPQTTNLNDVPHREIKNAANKAEAVLYQEPPPLKKRWLNYAINPNLSEMTALEYAEITQLTAAGDEQLHNIMQVLYRPITSEDKKTTWWGKRKGSYRVARYEYDGARAELFRNEMTMDVVFPVYVFFCNILTIYNAEIKLFSREQEAATTFMK